MTRYLIAHDIDSDDEERWFVVDAAKAEGSASSWREANELRKQIMTTIKAGE